MICEIQNIPVYYEQYGDGKPIIFIHGWSVDHRLMSGCFEPIFNQLHDYKRIYLDLPGMGRTPSANWIKNSDNTLEILIEFVNNIIGNENFLLAGESYGGYLSMGLIHEIGNRIDGILLLCPMVDSWETINNPERLPKRKIIWQSGLSDLNEEKNDIKTFLDVAVVATQELFEKFKNNVLSGIKIHDKDFLSKYKGEYNHDLEKALRKITFEKPACILTGRQDDHAGYSAAYDLLDRFPRATFVILDCAGHNLQIDIEPTFAHLVMDWIWRVELEDKRD